MSLHFSSLLFKNSATSVFALTSRECSTDTLQRMSTEAKVRIVKLKKKGQYNNSVQERTKGVQSGQ